MFDITDDLKARHAVLFGRMIQLMEACEAKREAGKVAFMRMQAWGGTTINGEASDALTDGLEALHHDSEVNTCGTVACLGGWMTQDPFFQERGLKTPYDILGKGVMDKFEIDPGSTEPTMLLTSEEDLALWSEYLAIWVDKKTLQGEGALLHLFGLPPYFAKGEKSAMSELAYEYRANFLDLFSSRAESPHSFIQRIVDIRGFAAQYNITLPN